MIIFIIEEEGNLETMFWIWLAVIAVALIVEIVTLDLVSIWFSFGAIIPFILSAIGGIPLEIQIVVFVVVSAVLIIFIRKYAQKWLFKNMNAKTNIDVYIGKTYKLLEETNPDKCGSLKINGVVWTAIGENGETIEKGEVVEIVKVDGNKMIVKKVEKQTASSENDKENESVEEEKTNQEALVKEVKEEK